METVTSLAVFYIKSQGLFSIDNITDLSKNADFLTSDLTPPEASIQLMSIWGFTIGTGYNVLWYLWDHLEKKFLSHFFSKRSPKHHKTLQQVPMGFTALISLIRPSLLESSFLREWPMNISVGGNKI